MFLPINNNKCNFIHGNSYTKRQNKCCGCDCRCRCQKEMSLTEKKVCPLCSGLGWKRAVRAGYAQHCLLIGY
uniref:Uncharacterized protein n=1 Tax=Anguilla anguilla TaxID=7936 RepID=A0A0E9XZE8_ANGAN